MLDLTLAPSPATYANPMGLVALKRQKFKQAEQCFGNDLPARPGCWSTGRPPEGGPALSSSR